MTTQTQPALSREVFVRRRLFCIFLPLVVFGMFLFMWASMQTLTINGGSVLGFTIAGTGAIAAARDSRDRGDLK